MAPDEPAYLQPHVPGADIDAPLPPLERRTFDLGVYVLVPFAVLALAASLVLSGLAADAIPTLLDQRDWLVERDRGQLIDGGAGRENEDRVDELRERSIVGFPAFVAAFALWMAIAARNARHTRQGAVKGSGPGAAILSWIVPPANLVWPRIVTLRIHDASTRSTTSTVEAWWWFLVFGVLTNAAALIWGASVRAEGSWRQALNLNLIHLLGLGLVTVAGIMGALIVLQITLGQVRTRRRQQHRLAFERRRDASIRDAVAAADPFGGADDPFRPVDARPPPRP